MISAHTNRVPVIDGHTMTVSVAFEREVAELDVANALRTFRGRPQELALSGARRPIVVDVEEPNSSAAAARRRPRRGMAVTVGASAPARS